MAGSRLAIVIPAYKAMYLDAALESMAKQSQKSFQVYIGDDNSPEDLYSIVHKYTDKLEITYHRFEENIGGYDLVAQWERCIKLSKDEEWLWLFSDDDVMEERCVEYFFNSLLYTEEKYDLYRFNTTRINKFGNIIKKNKPYPDILLMKQYAEHILSGADTFVVEYIFKRKRLFDIGGFVPFDLAWGSDTATWLALSSETAIYTIKGPRVRWRYGGINISSLQSDHGIANRKIAADLAFFEWLENLLEAEKDRINVSLKVYWIARQLSEKKNLTFGGFKQWALEFFKVAKIPIRYLRLAFLFALKFRIRALLVSYLRKVKIIN